RTPTPRPTGVAAADRVGVGRVPSAEDKPVEAASLPGAKDKVAYTIAVITVSDAPLAPKGTKTVRLGFVPPPPMVAIRPAPFLPAVGMEGCFFLSRQPGGADFYVAGVLAFVDKNSPNFENQMALLNPRAQP